MKYTRLGYTTRYTKGGRYFSLSNAIKQISFWSRCPTVRTKARPCTLDILRAGTSGGSLARSAGRALSTLRPASSFRSPPRH